MDDPWTPILWLLDATTTTIPSYVQLGVVPLTPAADRRLKKAEKEETAKLKKQQQQTSPLFPKRIARKKSVVVVDTDTEG